MRQQITTLVRSATAQINRRIDGLDALLTAEGFDPART